MSKVEEKLEEKSPEEKWRRDPLGLIIWAALLIWVGFIFLAGNIGWLDVVSDIFARLNFQTAAAPFTIPALHPSAWSLIFIGAGLILLVEVLVRLLFPAYRRPVLGTAILAFILLGIGLDSWLLIWPVIIILIGLTIIYRGLSRHK